MTPEGTARQSPRTNPPTDLDRLLLGSQEMVALPTGELVPKGQAQQGRGTEIPKHHFYGLGSCS